ncbi:hypothetical protein [Monaibacterium marinum]|nr:hypothetical protein [Monaibacterium marinum]
MHMVWLGTAILLFLGVGHAAKAEMFLRCSLQSYCYVEPTTEPIQNCETYANDTEYFFFSTPSAPNVVSGYNGFEWSEFGKDHNIDAHFGLTEYGVSILTLPGESDYLSIAYLETMHGGAGVEHYVCEGE